VKHQTVWNKQETKTQMKEDGMKLKLNLLKVTACCAVVLINTSLLAQDNVVVAPGNGDVLVPAEEAQGTGERREGRPHRKKMERLRGPGGFGNQQNLPPSEDMLVPAPPQPPHPPRPPKAPRLPEELIKQYDANADGKLDRSEKEALHADITSGKVQLPKVERSLAPAHAEKHARFLETYDTNKNGQIDPEEQAVVDQDIASGKLQGPRKVKKLHRPVPPPATGVETPSNP
jgi:hypothetical protein